MKAVAIVRLGEPAELIDLPAPEPGAGQVRVRLRAAGVNPFDGKKAVGQYGELQLPFVPGVDGAGDVDAVGEGVSKFAQGDAVCGRLGDGGYGTYAQYTVVDEDAVITRIPEGVVYDAAAALPLAGITALGVLRELALAPGDKVLIIGATGGVGSFLTQLAAASGLEVVATARVELAERMIELGARATVDHTSPVPVPDQLAALDLGGFRALVDLAGARELVEAVAPLVIAGGKAISIAGGVDPASLAVRRITGSQFLSRPTTAMLEELLSMVKRGDLIVPLEKTLTLAEGPRMLEESRSNHMHGKTVLEIDG